jgi:hypothetical protein
VALAQAQYEVPRKAAEYPSHAAWTQFDIGAEYMVHSIPAENGNLFARDYLVVEVAIYPQHYQTVKIDGQKFTLHVNGAKFVLPPESPGMVAAAMKYPSWQNHPRTEANVGPVVIGPRADAPHFPGDPTGAGRLPEPRQHPNGDVPHTAQKTVEELVSEAALPEIETRTPVKGALYFFYDRKLKTIKTVDLVYEDQGSTLRLNLK